MDMGLGKTVSLLTAINDVKFDCAEEHRVLIIAPLTVAKSTWTDEIEKWDHLHGMTASKILGSKKERKDALKAKADIYIINRDNVHWLVSELGARWNFSWVVIDESSSFKSHSSIRFKSMQMVLPYIKRMTILTGTPAPNSVLELWPQVYMLDQGQRLGKNITAYRNRYFKLKNPAVQFSGYVVIGSNESEREMYRQRIYDMIGDICLSMKKEDWLELPSRVDQVEYVHLDNETMEKYNEFEAEQVMTMMTGEQITAVNAAVLINKLMQFASGAVYDSDKVWHSVHDAKMEKILEDIEALQGNPVLVFFHFQHEYERLSELLKKAKITHRKMTSATSETDLKDWNAGKIPVVLVHPKTASYGLNMQQGGHYIFWVGPTYSLEMYLQGVARLDRQGQKYPVINRIYACKGTVDEEILKSADKKLEGHNSIMDALNAVIDKVNNRKK